MARLVSEEDSEIVLEVPTGDTVLGRGPLLKITDKRVSRNHASLEWKNGNLRLCPRHHNPCFLRSVGESSYCPLTRHTWVELHHGDHISLLPDSLIYRVELRLENEGEGEVEEKEEAPAGCQETQSVGEERSPAAVREDTSTAVIAQQQREEEKEQEGSEVAVSTGRKRTLPAWLSGVRVEPKTTASKAARKPASKKRDTVVTSSEAAVAEPSRRTTSVQKDVDNVMTTPIPDSPTPDATGKRAAKEAALSDEEPAPQAESPVPSRETTSSNKLPPCPYGAECYRKNPSHFKEYSHGTVDERDKPECPYGADCYRKNPAHRKNYKHPGPPADPPTTKKRVRQTRTRRKKPRVSALAGESDDSEGPNTYDYIDSFIDDEEMSSESTSYGGDSEDSDWAPPSAGEGRGGDREGSLEADVSELREEANSFITNKKMWRS